MISYLIAYEFCNLIKLNYKFGNCKSKYFKNMKCVKKSLSQYIGNIHNRQRLLLSQLIPFEFAENFYILLGYRWRKTCEWVRR